MEQDTNKMKWAVKFRASIEHMDKWIIAKALLITGFLWRLLAYISFSLETYKGTWSIYTYLDAKRKGQWSLSGCKLQWSQVNMTHRGLLQLSARTLGTHRHGSHVHFHIHGEIEEVAQNHVK